MGFNKRRMESERAAAAAKEAEGRQALGRQIARRAGARYLANDGGGPARACRRLLHRGQRAPKLAGISVFPQVGEGNTCRFF